MVGYYRLLAGIANGLRLAPDDARPLDRVTGSEEPAAPENSPPAPAHLRSISLARAAC